jgi:hypothetical protein
VDKTWIRSDCRGSDALAEIASSAGTNEWSGHPRSDRVCRDLSRCYTLIDYCDAAMLRPPTAHQSRAIRRRIGA